MPQRVPLGTALLGLGGLALAALMAYTLFVDDPGGPRPLAPAAGGPVEVAVFFPDRSDWDDFRAGLGACLRSDLARPLAEDEGSVTVATARHGRPVRFAWRNAGGQLGTQQEVRRLAARPGPPVAIVGSGNTLLTAAIAEELRAVGGDAPLLLVPWATTVLCERGEPGGGPVALLDLYPGRTFRFCANNQRVADLVVDALAARDASAPPARAVLVVDRRDPYSSDLADSFHRAIGRAGPEAEIVERPGVVVPRGPLDPIGPEEHDLARRVWDEAGRAPAGRSTWVVLPLQAEPIRRLLSALRAHARFSSGDPPGGRLRVVCGDAIGADTLREQAGNGAFPVWCVTSSSPGADGLRGLGLDEDAHVLAEIASAVLLGLDSPADEPATPEKLREALSRLDLPADAPGAFGRSLAFAPSGERRGGDLGLVLASMPDGPGVLAFAPDPDGRWGEPTRLPDGPPP